jgi:uncharacterized protein with HEPN domain
LRDDREKMLDIMEAIECIEKYALKGRDTFQRDELVQIWMIHHIQTIGEAAARLSESFRASHPEIPWRQIVTMRNILIHAYFAIDKEEVWNVVERDIPLLKELVRTILGAV